MAYASTLLLLLGLTAPFQPPLECVDTKGRIVVPAAKIRQVGQGVSRPKVIQRIKPVWPEGVRQLGPIIVEAVIDTSGGICATRILRAPSKELGDAVVTALRETRFRPAKAKGQTVPVRYVLTVNPHPR